MVPDFKGRPVLHVGCHADVVICGCDQRLGRAGHDGKAVNVEAGQALAALSPGIAAVMADAHAVDFDAGVNRLGVFGSKMSWSHGGLEEVPHGESDVQHFARRCHPVARTVKGGRQVPAKMVLALRGR